jgi:hypothetical protein
VMLGRAHYSARKPGYELQKGMLTGHPWNATFEGHPTRDSV